MESDFFFYQDGGKTVGPVTKADLKERIKDGKVRLFDLIMKEGEADWRMALEHLEFKDDFKEKAKTALRDRPWVCLQRKSPDGFDFTTTGPFSFDEVREALMAGKVSYTDYVWRSGFTEWKRIGLLEDFNPRLRKPEPLPESPPENAADLMQNVVEIKRPRPPVPEEPPPDAGTGDLTKKDDGPPRAVPGIRYEPAGEVSLPPVTTSSSIRKPDSRARRRRKNVPWLDWGIVAILVVVLGAVAVVLSRNIKRHRTLDVPPATVVETVPPHAAAPLDYEASDAELNAPEPAEDEPPEETADVEPVKPVTKETAKAKPPEPAKKGPPKAPTELVLNVQNRSNKQARIEIKTNGGLPVYFQVVGTPGHVSNGAAYYKYMRLKPTGSMSQPLDLSKVKLPQGKLVFRAWTGELRKEAKLNIGINDPRYKQTINRVRKLHAYTIWSERLQLLKLSDLLESRIAQAVAGQKFSAKGLEALNQVRLVNGYKYVLFDDWFELKGALDEAKKQPSTALVAKVKRVHDKMVAYSVWK